MAVDHVRVYSGVPAGGPTPGIFFTRWITHFCAPAFVFFAGTAAFLHGRSRGDTRQLAGYLALRGLLLVVLELTFLRLAWTFNVDYAHYVLAGVIWMLGWCMVLLAALLFLRVPLVAIGAIGAVIVVGHNLLDPLLGGGGSTLAAILYLGPAAIDGQHAFVVLYSLVPWIGVMALGYAFGTIMIAAPERRDRLCLLIGLAATAAFIVLRVARVYGDPRPWNGALTLAFLNTTKYPASLQFLLMTLGPTIALLPLAERAKGPIAGVLDLFGRVPLFYYLLHIPLIHTSALVVSYIREGHVNPWLFANHPMMNPPPPRGYMWSLALLYLVLTIDVAILYVPCRWFAELKARRRDSWLGYI
jgi:uncharacterized membrane protein